jgi:hypothetical protein
MAFSPTCFEWVKAGREQEYINHEENFLLIKK